MTIAEKDISALLEPLDIDDIIISTERHHLKINYSYCNLNFVYAQETPNVEGNLQASIRAFHNKSKAHLSVNHSLLSISSDSNIDIVLEQNNTCILNNIRYMTESLKDDIYETLDNLGLIPY